MVCSVPAGVVQWPPQPRAESACSRGTSSSVVREQTFPQSALEDPGRSGPASAPPTKRIMIGARIWSTRTRCRPAAARKSAASPTPRRRRTGASSAAVDRGGHARRSLTTAHRHRGGRLRHRRGAGSSKIGPKRGPKGPSWSDRAASDFAKAARNHRLQDHPRGMPRRRYGPPRAGGAGRRPRLPSLRRRAPGPSTTRNRR